MDEKVSEQIKVVIDALTDSHTRARILTRTMRKQHVHVDAQYDHPDNDIKQLIGKLHYMQLVAERQEAAAAVETRRDQAAD